MCDNICVLRHGDTLTEDVEGIKASVSDHFKSKFQDFNHIRPEMDGVYFNKLSVKDRTWLVAPFSLFYIKEAIWNFAKNKALTRMDSQWGSTKPLGTSFK